MGKDYIHPRYKKINSEIILEEQKNYFSISDER